MLTPGVRFDRYEIESLLGEGGMGRVYLARDTLLGRNVALKVLHRAFADAEGPARLLREARAAAALDHPNAVAIFDVGEVAGVAYLAMEYIEGRCLRDCIGDMTIPVMQRLRWLADIARALAGAHARGLVHRDIKPANVMIRPDGVVKVLDFGIARQTQTLDSLGATARELGSGGADTLTGPGMVVGTPDYMAPEQMLSKPVDGRSDQFAWGVTAYELLSGVRPWSDSSDFVRLVAEVVSPEPVRTLRGHAEVPPAIIEVVDRALHKEPGARFNSMNEIVQAIDRITAVRRSVPPQRKRRLAGAAVGGAVIATVAIAGILSLRGRGEAPHQAATSAAPSVPVAPSPSPAPAAVATSMVDIPVPAGARPEAVLALRRARQDLHDADLWRGSYGLRNATRLDPSLVSPLVTLLTWDIWQGLVEPRGAFSSARQLRASLSERDRALLDAVSPVYASELGDIPAAVAKLTTVAAEFPGDAEVQAILAYWLSKTTRTAEAEAAALKALAIDPTFAGAQFTRAWITHDPKAQQKALEDCVALSPTAASCIRSLARVRQQAGDCTTMEVLAHKLSAIEPDFEWSYVYVLNAIVARGEPRSQTVEVLHAIEASARAQARAEGRPETGDTVWPALVAFHYGAFDEGRKLLARLPNDDTHTSFSTLAADETKVAFTLLAEMESGELKQAAQDARAYVERRRLMAQGSVTLDAIALRVLHEAGHEPATVTAPLAAKWAEQDGHFDGPVDAPLDEMTLRAVVASTPDAARALVAGVDAAAHDLSSTTADTLAENAIIGHVLATGGRPEAAIPLLEEASRACGLAHAEEGFTFARVEAQLDLAEVLAANGDTAAACTWLGKIVQQWGKATPRSVTADKAKARRKTLACHD